LKLACIGSGHEVVPLEHEQLPATQFCDVEQALPQPPQLFGSVLVLVHTPPHSVRLPWQVHAPPLQVAPAGQALPQLPQLFGSVAELAHEQAPPEHTWPDEHEWPQLPQLFGSVVVFVHAPPHTVV
jgi:hypothetical protein